MNKKGDWTVRLKEINNSKPSILLISITSPLPESTGGARGVAHSVLPLANEYNFHLLIVGNDDLSSGLQTNLEEYRKYFCSVSFSRRVEIPKNILLKGPYFLERLLWELPFLDINFYSSRSVRKAEKIISEFKIDILELHTSHVAYFKYFFPKIPTLLMSHNIESELFPFWERPCPRILRPFYDYLVRKSRASSYAVEILNKWGIEKMAFVTPEDKDKVLGSVNKTVLSVSFEEKNRKKREHTGFNVTWVGTFDWGPNVEAMEWFADKVFPLIKDKLESGRIKLKIVGIHPTEKILSMATHPSVSVLGFVENLDEILDETDLSIAPIVSGAGIKVKVLEAMSRGIPVLSTNMGLIGTGLKHNDSALVTDDPEEFANLLLEAPKSKDKLSIISINSKEIFSKNFSRKNVLLHKRDIYSELLSLKGSEDINRGKRKGLPPLVIKAINKIKRKLTIESKKFFNNESKPTKNEGIATSVKRIVSESPYFGLSPMKPIEVVVIDENLSTTAAETIDFSVVICIKNEEKILPALFIQLESQSVKPKEVIFIDHFSSDASKKLIEEYQARSDIPIKLFSCCESPQFKSRGTATLAGNRNFGLTLANCPYILFIDAGNEFDTNFFSNLVGVVHLDESIDLVGCIYRTQSKVLDEIFTYKWQHVDYKNFIPACRALLIKKSLAIQCGGFLDSLSYACEDVCFCLSYRKISRKWAFNLKAEVVWNAPGTSEELWKKFTAYGLGGGESGFADFDNYQNYQYFFNTKTLPIELNNLQILPPLFYGNIMGRNLRGEFDKRQGSNKLLLLFINKSLYFSNSSRSILTDLTKEKNRVIVISADNPKLIIWDKLYLDVNCWQIELFALRDFKLSDLITRYGYYFTCCTWEIITDKDNITDEVKKYAEKIKQEIRLLFNR